LPIFLYEIDPFKRIWERFEPLVNPWATVREKDPRPAMGLEGKMFADVMLGNAVLAILRAKAEMDNVIDEKMNDDITKKSFAMFEKILPSTLHNGALQYGQQLQMQAQQLLKLAAEFKPLGAAK
jgi:hypothetical protein